MRQVSVTAHRRLSDTGIQKTTLDTTVLHQNVALSMADVLTRHSSLFIKSYGRATESTAEFRGTSPSHTQVLWNGLKINSPMLGTVDFSTIPAYFVDEANLLHGASSLTLTGGGLGGAVDLKTLPQTETGPGLQYVQGFGSFETYDQFLRLTYGTPRLSSSTRLVYSASENNFPYTNYDKKIDVRDADGKLLQSYHPTERNRSGYFRDLHALQDFHVRDIAGGTLAASVWYSRSRRGLPFLSVDYRDDTEFKNEQVLQSIRNVLSWQRPLGTDWHVTTRAGYTYQDIAYDYSSTRQGTTSVITASRSYSQQAFLQGRADFMPAPDWLLTADAAFTHNHVRSNDRTPFHIGDNYNRGRLESTLSLAAKYRPTPRLSLSALLREEIYRHDAVPPIPALFAEYTLVKQKTDTSPLLSKGKESSAEKVAAVNGNRSLPKGKTGRGTSFSLIFKTSVARNYRYPTMDDLYFQPGGNPDLRPERGITYDGGLEGSLVLPLSSPRHRSPSITAPEDSPSITVSEDSPSITVPEDSPEGPSPSLSLRANLSAFNSYITDWILWTPNAKGFWQPANLKRVHNYGVEATLTTELTLPADWRFTLMGNYAYTPSINQSRDLDDADTSYGKQLVYVPRHSANLTATARWHLWQFTYQWHSYSERFTTTSNEVSRITGRLRPYYMSHLTLERQFRWHTSTKASRRPPGASIKAVIYNLLDSEYVTVLSRPMAGRHCELFLEIKL